MHIGADTLTCVFKRISKDDKILGRVCKFDQRLWSKVYLAFERLTNMVQAL